MTVFLCHAPLSDRLIVWSTLYNLNSLPPRLWVLRDVTQNYRNWVLIVVSQGNHRSYMKTSPKMPWFLLSNLIIQIFHCFWDHRISSLFLSNKSGVFLLVTKWLVTEIGNSNSRLQTLRSMGDLELIIALIELKAAGTLAVYGLGWGWRAVSHLRWRRS